MSACAACLRRASLLAWLSSRIAAALGRSDGSGIPLLELSDADLVARMAPRKAREFFARMEAWDEGGTRLELDRMGVSTLCRHQESFPQGLLRLVDPPAAIFAKGRLDLLAEDNPRVTIVGGRRASSYGLDVTYTLARGIAEAGVTVVSGLALGADAEAHRGALDAGGPTIAVLPRGVDAVYPRFNRVLYERTCATGLAISELPPGAPPFRWSFPARNRLMAALGAMTVVTEAADPSGSLITSDFALALGTPVGAVPGRVTSGRAAGTNRLLRDGAAVIRSAADVLDEVLGAENDRPRHARPGPPEELRPILDAVESADTLDGMARVAGLEAGAVRAALCRLELLGFVKRTGVSGYERTHG